MRHGFVDVCGALREVRRVVETGAQNPCACEDWARFPCSVAHGDNNIELPTNGLGALGQVMRDIDADLGHRTNGKRMQPLRVGAGRVSLDAIVDNRASPTFSHLAATGVSCAEEQDARTQRDARLKTRRNARLNTRRDARLKTRHGKLRCMRRPARETSNHAQCASTRQISTSAYSLRWA